MIHPLAVLAACKTVATAVLASQRRINRAVSQFAKFAPDALEAC